MINDTRRRQSKVWGVPILLLRLRNVGVPALFVFPLIVLVSPSLSAQDFRELGEHKEVPILVQFDQKNDGSIRAFVLTRIECGQTNIPVPRSGHLAVTNGGIFQMTPEKRDELQESGYRKQFILDYRVLGESESPIYSFEAEVLHVKPCR